VGITIVNSPPIDTSFCIIRGPFYFINEITSIDRLTQLTDGKVCLRETGVDIKTGEIVWGPKFTGNTSPSDPILIRNSFITCNGTLVIPNKPRQQLRISAPAKYIISEPVILVNRGNGNNGNLNIRFAYFNPSAETDSYVAENHIYKICGSEKLLKRIYASMMSQETTEFIRLSNGSGFLTKKYLEILPISAHCLS
jgi:hypothetical protein